ncbi:MAG: hypothetical protein OXU81_02355 [Gammaproteobacteria bacterium]|nr:hypothetical protein [Gammaproteobacteria bacterium]
MPEGRHRIVLVEPGPAVVDGYGDLASQGIQHPRGAVRIDRDGSRDVTRRRYEVRSVGLAGIGPGWLLVDGGVVFRVESVSQVQPRRSRRLAIDVVGA